MDAARSKFTFRARVLSLAIIVLAGHASALGAGGATCRNLRTRQLDIPLQPYLGSQMAVEATVSGQRGLFLFDTGEGITTVTPNFAARIGCRPWGRVTGFRMSGERLDFPRCDNLELEVAGATLQVPIAGTFDIMSLLPSGAPQLAGAIGLDAFAGKAITLALGGRSLTIESEASLRTRVRSARELPIRLVRDAEGVALAVDAAVETTDGLAWMEVDSGNGGTLVVGDHIAELLSLDPRSADVQQASFELANGIRVAGPARVRNLIMDGDIGAAFLRGRVLTLDLACARAWLGPGPHSDR